MPSSASQSESRQRNGGYSRWLATSIVANLLLVAYLVLSASLGTKAIFLASTNRADQSSIPGGRIRSASGQKSASPNAIPSHPWSQIETTNLIQYAANLRQVGCPEETVCDILRPAVARWYTDCIERLDRSGDFWAVGTARQQQRKALTSARAALREEEDRFLATLPCTRDAEFDSEASFMIDLAFGFPSSPKREQIFALFQEISRRCLYWQERTGHIFLPEEVEAIHRERDVAKTTLAGLFSNRQIGEFNLRVYATEKWITDLPPEVAALHLDGGELREYCRIMVAHDRTFTSPAMGFDDLLDEHPSVTSTVQFESDMRRLLGDRYDGWLISTEPLAHQIKEIASKYGMEDTTSTALLEKLIGWKRFVAIEHEEAASLNPDLLVNLLYSEARDLRSQLNSALDTVPSELRSPIIKDWMYDFAEEAWSEP